MIQDSHLKHYTDSFVDIESKWGRCLLVTGAGGCRTDFVVGWLQLMMPSIKYQYQWHINPFNGQSVNSHGTQLYHRFFLWGEPMPQTPQCVDWLLDNYSNESDLWLIQKTHRPAGIIQEQLPRELHDKTLVLNITSDDDLGTAVIATWEFIVKTFIPKNPTNLLQWYEHERLFDDIDTTHSKQNYHLAVFDIMDRMIAKKHWRRHPSKFQGIDSKEIAYWDLLNVQGKQTLADLFGFKLTDHRASVWDNGLLIAKTADQIQYLDRIWGKDEVRAKILEHHPDFSV